MPDSVSILAPILTDARMLPGKKGWQAHSRPQSKVWSGKGPNPQHPHMKHPTLSSKVASESPRTEYIWQAPIGVPGMMTFANPLAPHEVPQLHGAERSKERRNENVQT